MKASRNFAYVLLPDLGQNFQHIGIEIYISAKFPLKCGSFQNWPLRYTNYKPFEMDLSHDKKFVKFKVEIIS